MSLSDDGFERDMQCGGFLLEIQARFLSMAVEAHGRSLASLVVIPGNKVVVYYSASCVCRVSVVVVVWFILICFVRVSSSPIIIQLYGFIYKAG